MREAKVRANLYKVTGQNDTESFVLAKNIQDATSFYQPPAGCGADLVGLDSIKKVELVNDFIVSHEAYTRIQEDVIERKENPTR